MIGFQKIKDSIIAYFRNWLQVIGLLLLLLQVSILLTIIVREATTYSLLFAENQDAAKAINVLNQTTWHTDNEWYAYGPLYYRVAHTMLLIDPLAKVIEKDDVDFNDQAAHLALMLTSFLALVLLSLFFASLAVPWWGRALSACLVLATLLSASPHWFDSIINNRVDVLLTLCVALATWATIRAMAGNTSAGRTSYVVAAILWGLALSTKISALSFLPGAGVVLLFYSWRRLRAYAQLLLFIAAIFATYILVGYPQSLNCKPVLDFLAHSVGSSLRPIFDPVFWGNLLFSIMWQPLMVILALILLFSERTSGPGSGHQGKNLLVAFAIPCIAFVSLFSVLHQSYMRHYVFPVMSSILVCSIPLLTYSVNRLYSRVPRPISGMVRFIGMGLAVLIVGKADKSFLPNVRLSYQRYQSRYQAAQVQKLMREHIEKGSFIIGDPYIPFDNRKHSILISNGWSRELLKDYPDAEVFLTSRGFYERFLDQNPTAWTLSDHSMEMFKQRQGFYRDLANTNAFADARGNLWKLRHRTLKSGWEIWEKQDNQ